MAFIVILGTRWLYLDTHLFLDHRIWTRLSLISVNRGLHLRKLSNAFWLDRARTYDTTR